MATDAAAANIVNLSASDRGELDRLFDRILTVHGAALRRLAAAYTRTESDRDDLLQEIAIAIWKALPGFRGDCSERTFVFRIAQNRSIAFLARAHLRRRASAEQIDVQDPSPSVETGMVQEQRAAGLKKAVQRLPLPYRQVVVLLLEGLDYSEIAEVLGISAANVGARLTRARQMLRAEMEKAG
ncbi:MAG TPA: sigma-70 family RNA polymerase sigma factor [Bryobacteraceae bacterium]|jgi:RNA polymerase sigma-70 factor (ECF subfamily)|nr:sigma-70 family RNA polymerase sigma factor [Bryobacteraceae bacterium]